MSHYLKISAGVLFFIGSIFPPLALYAEPVFNPGQEGATGAVDVPHLLEVLKQPGSSPAADASKFGAADDATAVKIGGFSEAFRAFLQVGNNAVGNLDSIRTALPNNAILITSPEYRQNSYFPGLVWSLGNKNQAKPQMGIWGQMTGTPSDPTGSKMYFGTSNNPATGITNQALTIDQEGRVGIGTPTPSGSSTVQISGGDDSMALFGPNAKWSGLLWVGAGTSRFGAKTAQVISTNGNLHLDAGTNDHLYLGYYNPTDTYINPTGGNVGIGTTNPQSQLTISRDTAAAAAQLELRDTGGINDGQYNAIRFTQGATGGTPLGSIRSMYRNSGNPDLAFFTRDFNTNVETEKMRIGSNGNVDMAGSLSLPTYNKSIYLYGTGKKDTMWSIQPTAFKDDTFGIVRYENGKAMAGKSLVILDSGYVGIGTTQPNVPLEVNSSVGDKGLRITATGKKTAIVLDVAEGDYGYLSLGGDTDLRGGGSGSSFGGPVSAKDFCIGVKCLSSGALGQWTQNGNDISYTKGNVGIGTVSPSLATLQVVSDNSFIFYVGKKNGSDRFAVKEDGTSYFYGGNVGIGTTEPNPAISNAKLLQIDDAENAVLGFRATAPKKANEAVRPEIRFSVGALSDGGYDRAVLSTESNHDLNFYTNSLLRGAILSSGEFQVGTGDKQSPSAQLLVQKGTEDRDVFRVQRSGASPIVPDLAVNKGGIVSIAGYAPSDTIAKLFVNGQLNATKYCIGSDNSACVDDWNTMGDWRRKGNDIYNKNTGNIGIGTAVPVSPLTVYNFSNVGPKLTLAAPSGGTPGIDFRPYHNESQWSNPAQASITALDNNWSADIRFATKTPGALANPLVDRMVIKNDGSVGIGTTGPGARLAIENGGSKTPGLTVVSGNNADDKVVYFSGNPSAGYDFTMLQNGNVGIGTGSPQRVFDLKGDVDGLSFQAGTGTPHSGAIRFGDNTGWKFHIGRSRDSVGGPLKTGDESALMTIQDNGRVGIGTTSPRGTLEVNGRTASADNGLPIILTSQAGNSTGIGGNLSLSAGAGGYSGTDSRSIGGKVIISGGAGGYSGSAAGGDVNLTAGAGGYSGSGSTTSFGGNLALTAGAGGYSGSARGGGITLTAGNGSYGGNANGGNIILMPGSKSGTGFAGKVGIGTETPKSTLEVFAQGGFYDDGIDDRYTDKAHNVPFVARLGGDSTAFGIVNKANYSAFAINIQDGGDTARTRGVPTFYDRYNGNWNASIYLKNGNVGIGTPTPNSKLDVQGGDINVGYTGEDKKFAKLPSKEKLAYATDRIGLDVAELFVTQEEVETGDILVVSDTDRQLKKSTDSYQSTIVGVVSGSPALLFEGSQLKLGAKPERFSRGTKPPVALAGRIPVKVSLENGPIKPGDYLTSSSKPGVAMKATEPGMTIGVALETYSGPTEGKILVFLNLGDKNTGTLINDLQQKDQETQKILKSLENRINFLEYKPAW